MGGGIDHVAFVRRHQLRAGKPLGDGREFDAAELHHRGRRGDTGKRRLERLAIYAVGLLLSVRHC